MGARVFPRCIDRNDRSTLSIIALWTTVNYIRAVSWHLISKERDVFVSRERERGEADASSKQKIRSGKREDEGFMTKRRRFAADVATPFRRDRCRGIAFILSQGSIEGGQWRKREGKMKRNARSRALSRRLFRKRWKRIARWGIDGRAIWVNIFYRIVRSPWLLAAAVLPRTGNRNRGRIEESLRSFSIFEKVGRSMENPIYPPG